MRAEFKEFYYQGRFQIFIKFLLNFSTKNSYRIWDAYKCNCY